jgi:hypothetical protein
MGWQLPAVGTTTFVRDFDSRPTLPIFISIQTFVKRLGVP